MTTTWKDELGDRVPPDWGREIDIFETQIQLKKQGKVDDKVFAETRLRRGTYLHEGRCVRPSLGRAFGIPWEPLPGGAGDGDPGEAGEAD